jgi:hypothetical protein
MSYDRIVVQHLLDRGFKVIPLPPASKATTLSDWPSKATNNPLQIDEWLKRWPQANLGVVTGPASGVFVVDIDGDAGRESLQVLEEKYGLLPVTLAVITGTGEHRYFRYPSTSIRNSQGKIGAGLDIRGAGGYVVAPGSTHPNGSLYKWLDESAAIVDAPEWLLALVTTGEVSEPLLEGKRHDALYAEACNLFRGGTQKTEVLAILRAMNEERCQPPKPDSEVADIVERVSVSNKPALAILSARSPMRWYAVDVPSFLADVNISSLTDCQQGWRTRLYNVAWLNGGRLPYDQVKLAKLANASDIPRFKKEVLTALFDFEKVKLDGKTFLVNPAMAEQHADKTQAWLQKKSAGQAGGKKKAAIEAERKVA